MTSKTKTSKYSTTKRDLDYTLYKYSDIQNSWIICEGYLNYRVMQIKLFNIFQFTMYYVVIAKIPIDDERETMGIYLYRNQKHKPSNFFELNEYDRISGHSSKAIKSSYYLFELIGKDPSDVEIFGANDASDRDRWVKFIYQALTWTKQNNNFNDLPIVPQGPRRSWKEDSQKTEQIDADLKSNYEPFNESRHSGSAAPANVFVLPHGPAPTIPKEKPQSVESHQRETENIYLRAMSISHSLIKEEDHPSNTSIKKSDDTPLEDKALIWKDIFYPNEPDDHARVLNEISQIGAFLVRPQSKKSSSGEHDYTLSIYAFGGIIKYRILEFSNGRYSLGNNSNEPTFDTIADLCQYYTNHHLPRSESRDELSNRSDGSFCLKWPYTYYLNNSNQF